MRWSVIHLMNAKVSANTSLGSHFFFTIKLFYSISVIFRCFSQILFKKCGKTFFFFFQRLLVTVSKNFNLPTYLTSLSMYRTCRQVRKKNLDVPPEVLKHYKRLKLGSLQANLGGVIMLCL